MKYLIYTLFFSISILQINSQNCLPDSTLIDSSAGVYPKPITPDNPNGGIHKKACVNKPYEFVLTVVIPDSVVVPLSPTPIPLEKAFIATKDAIKNLPKGIEYACNPPNCVFKKNTIGCLVLKGTPDDTNTPGDYKPIIKITFTINLGFPLDYADEYPGNNFPGEYILKLLSEQDCLTSSKDHTSLSTTWFPNPANQFIKNTGTTIEELKIYNTQGTLFYSSSSKPANQVDITGILPNGIYHLSWLESGHWYNQKIVIIK